LLALRRRRARPKAVCPALLDEEHAAPGHAVRLRAAEALGAGGRERDAVTAPGPALLLGREREVERRHDHRHRDVPAVADLAEGRRRAAQLAPHELLAVVDADLADEARADEPDERSERAPDRRRPPGDLRRLAVVGLPRRRIRLV